MNNSETLQIPDNIPSPCFVLDEKKLIKNLEILQEVANASGATMLLSLKGFAMWHIFPTIKKYLDGIAASSLHEVKLGNEKMGVKTHTYAPAYLEKEIDEIIEHSSHITFNSYNQYLKYRDKTKRSGIKMGLRINPEYSEVKTNLYNPCLPGSRLGITRSNIRNLPHDITGLHFHTMCEQSAQTLKNTLNIVEEKFGDFLNKISWINMGGGHLITAGDYDRKLLIDTLQTFSDRYNVKVILEPGAAIAWQTGCLVSTVQDIVLSNGVLTAILDTSFTAHMPDCLEMPYNPDVTNAKSPPISGKHAYRFGGLTCLAGDFVGPYSFERSLTAGDRVIFEDMMHYTMVKTNTFNGVNLPAIGIIKEDGDFILIKSFGYSDYKNRLS